MKRIEIERKDSMTTVDIFPERRGMVLEIGRAERPLADSFSVETKTLSICLTEDTARAVATAIIDKLSEGEGDTSEYNPSLQEALDSMQDKSILMDNVAVIPLKDYRKIVDFFLFGSFRVDDEGDEVLYTGHQVKQ